MWSQGWFCNGFHQGDCSNGVPEFVFTSGVSKGVHICGSPMGFSQGSSAKGGARRGFTKRGPPSRVPQGKSYKLFPMGCPPKWDPACGFHRGGAATWVHQRMFSNCAHPSWLHQGGLERFTMVGTEMGSPWESTKWCAQNGASQRGSARGSHKLFHNWDSQLGPTSGPLNLFPQVGPTRGSPRLFPQGAARWESSSRSPKFFPQLGSLNTAPTSVGPQGVSHIACPPKSIPQGGPTRAVRKGVAQVGPQKVFAEGVSNKAVHPNGFNQGVSPKWFAKWGSTNDSLLREFPQVVSPKPGPSSSSPERAPPMGFPQKGSSKGVLNKISPSGVF
jgi:hypothetical protein